MNWKEENKRERYIDDLTDEEAKHLAWLASGKPEELEILKIDRRINGNVIPHVEVHYKYYCGIIHEELDDYLGIFHNLDIYLGKTFHSTYCQREVFEYFSQINIK